MPWLFLFNQLLFPFLQLKSFFLSLRKFSLCHFIILLDRTFHLFFKNVQNIHFILKIILLSLFKFSCFRSRICDENPLPLYFELFLLSVSNYPVNILWMIKLNECKISHLLWIVLVSYHSNILHFSKLWKLIEKYSVIQVLNDMPLHH